MASTNKTENLGLSQWEKTDLVERADFNGNFEKIDEAYGLCSLRVVKNITLETTPKEFDIDISDLDLSRVIELQVYAPAKSYLYLNEPNQDFYRYSIEDKDWVSASTKEVQSHEGVHIIRSDRVLMSNPESRFFVICSGELYSVAERISGPLNKLHIKSNVVYRLGDKNIVLAKMI